MTVVLSKYNWLQSTFRYNIYTFYIFLGPASRPYRNITQTTVFSNHNLSMVLSKHKFRWIKQREQRMWLCIVNGNKQIRGSLFIKYCHFKVCDAGCAMPYTFQYLDPFSFTTSGVYVCHFWQGGLAPSIKDLLLAINLLYIQADEACLYRSLLFNEPFACSSSAPWCLMCQTNSTASDTKVLWN